MFAIYFENALKLRSKHAMSELLELQAGTFMYLKSGPNAQIKVK